MFDFLLGRDKNGNAATASTDGGPAIEAGGGAHEAAAHTPPTIALALGGGAARGFAHIGVIRTLIAKGFKPDVIVGTSIGAVVGAMYAAGHLDAFEEWARGLTRRNILSYLDFTFFGSGIIHGEKLGHRLSEQLGDMKSEELSLRFAAIATEVGTGHEIWLTRGPLVDNLRASYALPGIFTPVQLGRRWMVDGALVNPVPVSAARALGGRLVVAVNLNSDLFGRGTTIANFGPDDPDEAWLTQVRQRHGLAMSPERAAKRQILGAPGRPGFSTVMLEAFNIMQDRITRARLAGDPPDVIINPRLTHVGLLDFQSAEAAIQAGAEAAEVALAPIEEALTALT